ncbi:metallophosphoesterase [Pelobacter propionicus DSM 2379]|uniref:Metallophosphoesterase n=1 Tax=Pelobacter propionicus (strain DSM 2379 / NBRC 103807 / OttBd1) TaxID=338966 RepID=A1ASM4_PELPD|nr:metallophosphoesterase [Pelobacter propionicus DSM 2379]
MHFVKPNPAVRGGDSDAGAGLCDGGPFVLAHLSDPHLSPLPGVHPRDLLNKRLLGYFSWYRRRRHIHCPHVLDALLNDLAQAAPDHVAITGDLTNLGLPDEFRQAARWLERVGSPARVMVVPGNHECYVAAPWRETFGRWADYLAGDGAVADGVYPRLRVRGGVALIGLSTARPSLPFMAVGSLGKEQLDRLEDLLEQTGRRGLLRVVLLHHPPVPGSIAWRKRLTDASGFAAVIGRQGAELILHGHAHVSMERELVAGTVPVFGVSSSSSSSSQSAPLRTASYTLYRFRRRGDVWEVLLSVRIYSHRESRFVLARERELLLPAPAIGRTAG